MGGDHESLRLTSGDARLPPIYSYPGGGGLEEWGEYMKREIRKLPKPRTEIPEIFPAPESWLEARPSSYTPRLLRMGPLAPHPPRPASSLNMDRWKVLCVQEYLERHRVPDVDHLIQRLIPDPDDVIHIYSGLPSHDVASLQLLLTVDTVVLHEFLLLCFSPTSDYLFGMCDSDITLHDICRDLFLVGNQIPLSLVKSLSEMFPEKEAAAQSEHPGRGNIEDYYLWPLACMVTLYDPFLKTRRLKHVKEDAIQQLESVMDKPQHILASEHLLDCIYISCTAKTSGDQSQEKEAQESNMGFHVMDHTVQEAAAAAAAAATSQLEESSTERPVVEDDGGSFLSLQVIDNEPPVLEHSTESEEGARVQASASVRVDVRGARAHAGKVKAKRKYQRLPSASKLKKAGIKFEARDGNVSQIEYKKEKGRWWWWCAQQQQCKFYLPSLLVDDNTEDMLRNLLAYEQTSKGEPYSLCFYAMVMDSLIDTPKDVEILVRAEVLDNALGSREKMVQMWVGLGVKAYGEWSGRWERLSEELWREVRSPWRLWQVELRSTYLDRPWYWVPLAVALVLLLCAILQTLYTIRSFYASSSSSSSSTHAAG